MNILIYNIYILLIIFVFSQVCFSQNINDIININDTATITEVPKLDTFSFKYDFRVGDTLIYFVNSKDSITIDYGPPLFKIRFEKIMLTCDSITPDGHFIIKQELIEFRSRETYLEEKNIDRNTTPWLNVPVYIEIDTMGNRYKQYIEDSLILAAPPGGVFQPFILLPLMVKDTITKEYPKNRKNTAESWLIVDSNYIAENGMPIPVFRYSIYYRMYGMDDSLGLGNLLKITFSMTSQSAHRINTDDVKMLTTSINNAGGEVYWDTIHWIPKYYIHTIAQKLTIEDKIDKNKLTGFHHIFSIFVLDKIVRSSIKN